MFLFREIYLFPYYIVRFKPQGLKGLQYVDRGFHTTQYDLNSSAQKGVLRCEKSFHTTQYDLNKNINDEKNKEYEGFHTTQYDLNVLD